MKSASLATVLVAFITLCDAVPAPVRYALHEKRSSIPRFWARGSRVESNAILPVRIGLTQTNLESGYSHLIDV
jgi:tripeptidyl-peptidase-1